VFGREQALTPGGVARFIEETRGVEVGKQVRRALLIDRRRTNSLTIHGGPHDGRVVPHDAGQQGGRVVAVDPLSQVGPDLSALAVYAVALHAAFALEQQLTARRVNRSERRPRGAGETGNGDESNGPHKIPIS